MSTTPEGKIKAKVDAILGNAPCPIWHFRPVQMGYGDRALDYICCIGGQFVAIETKAPGEQPTKFQRITMIDMYFAGAKVFIVSNDEGLAALRRWVFSFTPRAWGTSL